MTLHIRQQIPCYISALSPVVESAIPPFLNPHSSPSAIPGSTGFLTDATGAVNEHIEYTAWADATDNINMRRAGAIATGCETWLESANMSFYYLLSPIYSLAQRCTSKELDTQTHLYYFGARYYDPKTSLWVSTDPILGRYLDRGEKENGIYTPANLGLYAYVFLNPIKLIDPDGNEVYGAMCVISGENAVSPPITVEDGTFYSLMSKEYSERALVTYPATPISKFIMRFISAWGIGLNYNENTENIQIGFNASAAVASAEAVASLGEGAANLAGLSDTAMFYSKYSKALGSAGLLFSSYYSGYAVGQLINELGYYFSSESKFYNFGDGATGYLPYNFMEDAFNYDYGLPPRDWTLVLE